MLDIECAKGSRGFPHGKNAELPIYPVPGSKP